MSVSPPSGNFPRYVTEEQYESDMKDQSEIIQVQRKQIATSRERHDISDRRHSKNEADIKKIQNQFRTLHNAVLGSERPNSRNQPAKAEIKKIKEIRGGMTNPRPTIVFEDDESVNVWNYRAPFGNAVGNWKPGDPVAMTRNVGGNGIDPDRVTNLEQFNPRTNEYEAVDGNKKGCPIL
jgi:hypothetical protein